MKGGEGFDSATINAGKKNLTVAGPDGEVLFKKGNGGSVTRVDSVEDLKVVGAKGKLLYDSNDPQGACGSGGPGGTDGRGREAGNRP